MTSALPPASGRRNSEFGSGVSSRHRPCRKRNHCEAMLRMLRGHCVANISIACSIAIERFFFARLRDKLGAAKTATEPWLRLVTASCGGYWLAPWKLAHAAFRIPIYLKLRRCSESSADLMLSLSGLVSGEQSRREMEFCIAAGAWGKLKLDHLMLSLNWTNRTSDHQLKDQLDLEMVNGNVQSILCVRSAYTVHKTEQHKVYRIP